MELFWKVYKLINRCIPKVVVENARYWMEAHFDFLWRKISFGQFGEDIVLLELLHRRSINKGFYVDIGAFAPKQFSNTYLLYKQGWRGINIDATPTSMAVFDKVRTRDINLEVAISDVEKELILYTWGAPTVVNTLSKAHAEHFTSVIGKKPHEITVHTERLEKILDKYHQEFSIIDVMNVDVEDHTMEVLQSNNWDKYKPSILIVEIGGLSIDDIVASKENVFLLSKGYKMRAWTNPSVFYELTIPPEVTKKEMHV
jgi:hypothetical protein